MSTLAVTLERLTIHPHTNADRLELAQVGLYRAVVAKGQFETGDLGIYIPEQAIIPDDLIEELGLTGKLAGKAKNRVKAVRLRGELSQGVVVDPFSVDVGMTGDEIAEAFTARHDFAEKLGITKWVPEIPTHMAGVAISGTDLLRWVDIENLQRYPTIFPEGEQVIVTEKIHGTCLVVTAVRDGDFLVSSKGLAHQWTALAENDENLYWRAVRAYSLREAAERMFAENPELRKVGIYGEVFGAGVQDLHYGASARRDETLGFRVFDFRFEYADGGNNWTDAMIMSQLCERYGLPAVPTLWSGPFDLDWIKEIASGATTLGGDHIREGVVIRSALERHSQVVGGRAIAKYVSPEYLTRNNGTEYE